MSERAPQQNVEINAQLPEGLVRRDGHAIDKLSMKVSKNDQERMYSLDVNGKHEAVAHDAVLEAYGYSDRDAEEAVIEARKATEEAAAEAEAGQSGSADYGVQSQEAQKVDLTKSPETKGRQAAKAKAKSAKNAPATFGSVFKSVNERNAKKQANEVMDLAVDQAGLFVKDYNELDQMDNIALTELVKEYGVDAVREARRVSRGMQNGEFPRNDAQAKIAQLERKKIARGNGDTSDLDARIEELKTGIERTKDSEKTRNEIARQKQERRTYNETRDIDEFEFWGGIENKANDPDADNNGNGDGNNNGNGNENGNNGNGGNENGNGGNENGGGNNGNGDEATAPQPPRAPHPPRQPERTRPMGRARRWGLAALAALGLVGGVAAVATESYKEDKGADFDIGNHGGNIDDIKAIDEGDNALGKAGVSEEVREHVARHAEQAGDFFESVSTAEGQRDFRAMQELVDDMTDKYLAQHPQWNEQRAREQAEKTVAARLDALKIIQEEAQATANSNERGGARH